MCVTRWCSLGGSICRSSCHSNRIAEGMNQEALDIEKCHEGEGVEDKFTRCAVQAWTSFRIQVSSQATSVIQE